MCTAAVSESIESACEWMLGFRGVECLEVKRETCQSDCVKSRVCSKLVVLINHAKKIAIRYMVRPLLNINLDIISRCGF